MPAIDLFTDASFAQHKNPTHFGIGMFMIDYYDDEKEYSNGRTIQFSKLEKDIKLKFRDKIRGNLNLYEIYAIRKALSWATKQAAKNDKIDTIRIYTDSLHAVLCYHGLGKSKVCDNFVKALKYQVEAIEKTNNLKITISHIKAHCKVYGNEKADKLAKKYN